MTNERQPNPLPGPDPAGATPAGPWCTPGFGEAMFQAMQDGLAVLDASGRHVDVNPSLCRMTGFSRAECLGARPVDLYWDPGQPPAVALAAAGRWSSAEHFEVTFVRKNGERFPVLISPFALRDGAGHSLHYVATIKDISDLKRTHLALEQARTQAEQASCRVEDAHRRVREVNLELAQQNRQMIESLQCAALVQRDLLAGEDLLRGHLKEAFVFHRPRDIVSGDFFWFHAWPECFMIAAVDCTGHGVAGALITVWANDLLAHVVLEEGIHLPDQVLQALEHRIRGGPAAAPGEPHLGDAIEVAVCLVEPGLGRVHFAGAHLPLYQARGGQLGVVRGARQPLGGHRAPRAKEFPRHTLQAQPGDVFYLATDGYQDQLGGPRREKYMSQRLRDVLQSISHLPMDAQRDRLELELDVWKGAHSQTDDVLVIGLKMA